MAEVDLGLVVPKITESIENSESVYKLDIETRDGTNTTPNLMGGGGGGSLVTLWENPSPLSEFAAGTVELGRSLDDFDFGLLFVKQSTSSAKQLCPIGVLLKDHTCMMSSFQVGSGGGIKIRNLNVTGGVKATFSACFHYGSFSTTTYSTTNNFLIPLKILGYKAQAGEERREVS